MFSNNNQKLKILECYRSTPHNINLVPRFEETREKDKVDRRSCFETFDERWYKGLRINKGWQRKTRLDLIVLTIPWFEIYEIKDERLKN